MRLKYIFALTSVVLTLIATEASAKRVIWVGNSPEAKDAGGHYAKNPQPGDIIQQESAGTTLAQARGKIANNDTFIIITHGAPGSISVGGNPRDGFKEPGTGTGTGEGCGPPVQIPPITETGVTIILHVCHSDTDSDGNGAKKSVVQSLRDIVTGAGSTVTGKDGTVTTTVSPVYKNNPTDEQKQNTLLCLYNAATTAGFGGPNRHNNWISSMSYPTRDTSVTAALAACLGNGDDVVQVNFTYGQPQYPETDPPLYEQEDRPREYPLPNGLWVPDLQPIVTSPCNPGCGGPVLAIPTTSEWGLIIMGGCLLIGGTIVLRRGII
jgi:hypothetical protein